MSMSPISQRSSLNAGTSSPQRLTHSSRSSLSGLLNVPYEEFIRSRYPASEIVSTSSTPKFSASEESLPTPKMTSQQRKNRIDELWGKPQRTAVEHAELVKLNGQQHFEANLNKPVQPPKKPSFFSVSKLKTLFR